jgi:YcxB-like protein
MSIQFSGTLTEQDFNRFQQYCMPAFCKWLFKWFPWFWIGFILIRVFSGYYSIDMLVFDLFVPFYFFLFLPKFRERQIKRAWESNKLLQAEASGIIDRDGLVWRNIYSETRYPWEILLKYQEKSDFLILYVAINQAIILPHHFFQSEEDWQEFRHLVIEKLPNK